MKFAIGLMAYTAAAMAQAALAEEVTPMPLIEGGLLSVGVLGLVAGIRMIQRKAKR